MFDAVSFFDNVSITLYFDTFELHMEITLQLRFVFACHCDVFFIISQLRYLFVRCSYVFDDVRITLHSSTFDLRTEITLKNGHFLDTLVGNEK